MTLVPNEAQQELNRQYDIYAAAREEYRKKIAEQADEIERLRAALRDALSYSTIGNMPVTIYENARAALGAGNDGHRINCTGN